MCASTYVERERERGEKRTFCERIANECGDVSERRELGGLGMRRFRSDGFCKFCKI